MQLNEIQARFKTLMLDHPDALERPPEELAAQFAAGDIPLSERLKVYRNNIVGSLSDVMSATFPITEKLVGEPFFETMARSFILENPPQSGCLNFYGAGFDAFIRDYQPAAGLPYLPDVAGLEIAINDSYYAPDEIPLSELELATIPPEKLPETSLRLCAHVRLINAPYPLTEIRAFCLNEDKDEDRNLDISRGGGPVMVFRLAYDVEAVPLADDEYAALQALQAGQALGGMLETVLNQYEAFDFQAFLQKHLTHETFLSPAAN